jgi:Ca2+-transporting ATPase
MPPSVDVEPSGSPAPSAEAWHALSPEEVAGRLRTDADRGLTATEAAARLERCGRNELPAAPGRSLGQAIADQFKDVVVWVLLAAVGISFLVGEYTDAAVIVAIVVLNAVLGVVQERKAEQSLAALKRLSCPTAQVVRDGERGQIPAVELVPGDVVCLESGDFIPADLRLVQAANLRVEEAALTGESAPVNKLTEGQLDPGAPLADRTNLAFSGTAVTTGRGQGIVVATGTHTEIGAIARMLSEIEAERTPLQERLEGLGKWLALVVLGICIVVFAAGALRGSPPLEMFLTAISLAVAAIPEGMTAAVTIVLALGMTRMVRRHAIIRRLRAVETLGSVTVICTDKTGTLTQNLMTVRRFWADGVLGTVTGIGYAPEGEWRCPDGPVSADADTGLRRMIEAAVLCNDAFLSRRDDAWALAGDPTEGALLAAGARAGLDQGKLRGQFPRQGEIPFEADRRRMSTFHPLPSGGFRVLVKGGVGVLLERSATIHEGKEVRPLTDEDRQRLRQLTDDLGAEALRVLAFAYRDLDADPRGLPPEAVEKELIFTGIVGMMDPPRDEAREAIGVCRRAGIRPVMITGDQATTASAIARELELTDGEVRALTGAEMDDLTDDQLREQIRTVSVYARVSPADKLRLVRLYQEDGQIVAMTGDGVNDAPALKKADIGIAMGVTGTDVAKAAADMVLADDNFASIVAAVEEGRGIFANIRKFVYYLLSCNISEVLTLFLAILTGLPQPLVPAQILWINLVTDGLPALALGMEPKEPGLMERPPRDPQEGVLHERTIRDIVWYGGAITLAALAAYAHGLYWFCLVPSGLQGLDALQAAFRPDFWHAAAEQPLVQAGLDKARTLTFATLAACQLIHSLNCRSGRLSLFQLGVWTNPHLLGAIALSSAAQLLALYTPIANRFLKTQPIGGLDLAVVVVLSLTPLAFGEVRKWWLRRGSSHVMPRGDPQTSSPSERETSPLPTAASERDGS